MRLIPLVVVAVSFLPSSAGAQLAPLKVPASVYELKGDGTGWKKVFTPGEFDRIGSIRMSPDGQRLSFDGIRSGRGDGWNDAALISCRLDGSDFTIHGKGAMPTFSPDGKKLAFSSYDDAESICVFDISTKAKTSIAAGWGVQWSPVAQKVAYTRAGGDVVVHDVETGAVTRLFPEGKCPYVRVQYNMAWSHDGKSLAIEGQRPEGTKEIAVVDSQGAELGFKVVTTVEAYSDGLAWHPSGKKLAYRGWAPGNRCGQQYVVDLDQPGKAVRIPGQPDDFDNASLCWTLDGEKMLIVSWQRR